MTTVGTVVSWNPDAVASAGTDLDTAADALLTRVKGLDTAADRLRDGWQGVAADAAHRAVVRDRQTGTDLVKALDGASAVLATGASSIRTARNAIVWIRSDAASRGFAVQDDGRVVPPTPPPVMSAPEDAAQARADYDERVRALSTEAQRIADDLGVQVQAAVDADATLARELTTLPVPRDLRTAAEEIRRRHENGEDPYEIAAALGIVGGAAVTVKALLGVWKGVSKSAALASFLKNGLVGGLEYGAAVRWLTTGAGDASAFLRAAQAAQRMEAAAGVFQFGKPPTWLAGPRTLLGKAFLPLTIATGAMDVVTGGGYDGARGVTTRVLGGAGALGGGALMLGLASNPVGWGIAAGAVAAYTLWTAGNFVYDHWDDITDFAGSAASWVGDRAGDVGRAAGDAVDWAGDRLSGVADTAKGMVSGAASHLGGALDAVGIF